jgi:hypothetical protein
LSNLIGQKFKETLEAVHAALKNAMKLSWKAATDAIDAANVASEKAEAAARLKKARAKTAAKQAATVAELATLTATKFVNKRCAFVARLAAQRCAETALHAAFDAKRHSLLAQKAMAGLAKQSSFFASHASATSAVFALKCSEAAAVAVLKAKDTRKAMKILQRYQDMQSVWKRMRVDDHAWKSYVCPK